MKRTVLVAGRLLLAGFALAAAGHALSQGGTPSGAIPATPAGAPASAASATDVASGEVRRIDREARKITLRHGEIPNLAMPPMTMVFQVTDAAFLDRVKVGDKVRFRADQQGGAYRVIELQLAP